MSSVKSKEDLPKSGDIVREVFSGLKEYSKLAGQIPAEDYEYHEAFPGFRKLVKTHSEFLIDLMDSCSQTLPKGRRVALKNHTISKNGVPTLTVEQRAGVMDAIDSLLENVDTVLDELKGRKLNADQQLAVSFGTGLESSSLTSGGGHGDSSGKFGHILRPQLTFSTPVDNSTDPFVPYYCDVKGCSQVGEPNKHPFETEIRNFHFPEDQLTHRNDTPYISLEECPLCFIDTVDDLKLKVEELLKATEIAVDLEHHDAFSYQGFTCLMQISTRTCDYIVDCLKLRSSMGLLAPVFLNGNILKVFHGAREDVRWLQKDFGLYLINFFDTSLALQALHMPYSLAFAVDHFCQVKLNKRFQTADWRMRPLSGEMVHYARQDTHYLLYIYDRLKSLLLNSEAKASVGNLLTHVFQESKLLSLERYEKPKIDPEESYKLALDRSLGGLSKLQRRVARDVFNWRDATARIVDDSPNMVLHLSSVLAIACKLPTTAKEVFACSSPVSAVLRKEISAVVELVKTAIAEEGGAEELEINQKKNSDGEAHEDASENVQTSLETRYGLTRPVESYRPMTGTLSSITTSLSPPLLDSSPVNKSPHWRSEKPSVWFQAMKQLSTFTTVIPQVSLPGADALKRMNEEKKRALLALSESKNSEGDSFSAGHKRNRDDTDSENDDHPANLDATTGDSNGANSGTADGVTQKRKKSDDDDRHSSEAVSIRQAYGSGVKERKRAQKKK